MPKRVDMSNSGESPSAAVAPPSDPAIRTPHSALRTPQSLVPSPQSPVARAKSFFQLSYREARAIALIVALVLWTIAIVNFATPGYRTLAGPLKGGDLIFFYTLGKAARSGDQ